MKLIKAVISPKRLEAVKAALLEAGIVGVTAHEVKGFGIHRSQLEQKISKHYVVEFTPRIMLEIVLPESRLEKAEKIITSSAWTGRLGDGKMFVLPVEEAIRVRTGERGETVL